MTISLEENTLHSMLTRLLSELRLEIAGPNTREGSHSRTSPMAGSHPLRTRSSSGHQYTTDDQRPSLSAWSGPCRRVLCCQRSKIGDANECDDRAPSEPRSSYHFSKYPGGIIRLEQILLQ